VAGLSQAEASEVIAESIAVQAEAIDDRNYSREQSEQIREYFRLLEDGE